MPGKAADRQMLVPGVHEAVVDLIAHDQQVVALSDIRDCPKLLLG